MLVSNIFVRNKQIILNPREDMTLGEKIQKLRKEKKWSLDRLAQESNTSKSYIWELENRSTRNPTADKLTSIAKALGVTTDYLLNESTAQVDEEEAQKTAFFRKYNSLTEKDKKSINQMMDMWSKDDEDA